MANDKFDAFKAAATKCREIIAGGQQERENVEAPIALADDLDLGDIEYEMRLLSRSRYKPFRNREAKMRYLNDQRLFSDDEWMSIRDSSGPPPFVFDNLTAFCEVFSNDLDSRSDPDPTT